MKTLMTVLTIAAVLTVGSQRVSAGHCNDGWSTAGKILTGLVIGGAVAQAVAPPPVYAAPPVVYSAPVVATAPVYVQPAPAPVVVYSAPVYYPRPYYYYPAAPLVGFRFGYGGNGCGGYYRGYHGGGYHGGGHYGGHYGGRR